jgi:hypothetical protein
MADDLVINLEVNYQDMAVDKFIKGMTAAELVVKRLDAALKAGLITDEEAYRGLYELEAAQKKNSIAVQDAIRLQKEATRVAKENATAAKEKARVDKEEAAARELVATATKREADQLEYLRTKYNQIYASSQLYERSLVELNQAHMLGVTSVKQHEAALESLNMEYQNFQSGIAQAGNRFAQYSAQSASGMNKFGVAAQQTGYQVSDFLVQIQGGTNPLVAFSQQATQLAGLLYLLPPAMQAAKFGVLGFSVSIAAAISVVTIGIPLLAMLAMSFFSSGKDAKEGAKSIDQYKAALESLKSTVQSTQVELDKLTFGTADTEVAVARRAMQAAQEELQVLQAASMRTTARGIIYDPSKEQEAAITAALEGFRNLTLELNKLLFKQEALAEAQDMLNGGLSVAGGLQRAAVLSKQEELQAAKDYEQSLIRAYGYYAKTRVEADKIAAANAKANEGAYADAQFAKQKAMVAFYKEQEEAENKAGEKAEYLKQAFRLMAGETTSLSAGMKELPPILDKAAIAAYKLAAAMGDTRTAASAVLSSMVQMDAARLRKQGQVQAAAAGFVSRPEVDSVASRAAVNAARTAILEKNNAPDKKKSGGDKKDPLVELQKQIALQEDLNGKTEAEKKVRQALGEDFSNYSPMVIKGLEDQIQKQIELEDRLKEQQGLYDTIQNSMEDAFMSMVDGTKSAKDAFKSMAAAIIKELYNVLVVQRLVGSFDQSTGQGKGLMGLLFKGIGGAFGGGTALAGGSMRANGGPVSAGQPYLVGERGPELIIPKSSGMVLTNGQTKAALGGASNDNYVVNNHITVTGSDSVMVRQEIAKMIPQISSATKAAMIDAKRRGGQMGNAFR